MKKSKWITSAAVFVLGASLAVAAPQQANDGAQAPQGQHHHFHGRHGRHMFAGLKKLNLTDAQKAQIRDLGKAFRQDNKAFFQSARQTRKDFRAAKQANDQARMDALKPTLKSQREQFKQLREQMDAKIASVLTPDQNAQWQQLKAERAAKWQARHKQQG